MNHCQRIICVTLAFILASPAAHAGFFGPDIVPLSPAVLKDKLKGQPLAVEIKAASLEFKSKGAAVAGVVFGFLLSSALASGSGPRPGMSAQQNMQSLQQTSNLAMQASGTIATSTTALMNSQAVKSAGAQAKEGPIGLITPQLEAAFAQAYGTKWRTASDDKAAADAEEKFGLRIEQTTWMVDFSIASSDYDLRYKLGMTLTDLTSKAINKSVTCEGTYDKKMPDDDWKKDDYQAVADASKAIASLCLDKFLGEIDIVRADPPVKAAVPATPRDELVAAASATPDDKQGDKSPETPKQGRAQSN
jgi:hypothetical protein